MKIEDLELEVEGCLTDLPELDASEALDSTDLEEVGVTDLEKAGGIDLDEGISTDLDEGLGADLEEAVSADLELGASMSGEEAETLIVDLLAKRGDAITIGAGAVEKIDTSCIEVLLSAAKLWAQDNSTFKIVGQSEAFTKSVEILGINFNKLEFGGL